MKHPSSSEISAVKLVIKIITQPFFVGFSDGNHAIMVFIRNVKPHEPFAVSSLYVLLVLGFLLRIFF